MIVNHRYQLEEYIATWQPKTAKKQTQGVENQSCDEKKMLNMSRSNIDDVDANSFDESRTAEHAPTRLDLSANRLVQIRAKTFHELKSLEEIDLSENRIEKLCPNAFVDLRHLKLLDLSYNNLTVLDSGALRLLSNLTELYLSHNRIAEIGAETFSDLRALKKLSLYRNCLSSLSNECLRGLRSLQVLDLAENQIAEIATNAFVDLRCLNQIFLADNQLESIDRRVLEPLGKSIGVIDLRGNFFSSTSSSSTMLERHSFFNAVMLPTGQDIEYLRVSKHELREELENNGGYFNSWNLFLRQFMGDYFN